MMTKLYSKFEFEQILSSVKIAQQFVAENRDRVRYCTDMNRWFYYNGVCWVEDPNLIQMRPLVGITTNNYYNNHLPSCADDEQKIRFQRFVNRSLKANRLIQILKDVEIFPDIQVLKDRFDQHPTLLAVPNGIIDLESAELRPSEACDYITRIAATEYHPDRNCPEFEKFLLAITYDSKKLKEFLLYLLGYCLTGLTWEQKIYFLFGNGSNGKTVFLEIVRSVIGSELVLHADSKTLVKNGRSIREDVARFSGARLATCSEIGKNDVLDEPLLKGLAGGDRQVSRKLYQNSEEFHNQAKIIIATNILPDLEGTDFGIERRIVVIPFSKKFTGSDADATLKESLLKEKEGILALLVKYSQKYLAEGMPEIPVEIAKATSEYIESGNSVRCFVKDCCGNAKDTSQESTLRSVYESYVEYCKRNSFCTMGSRDFTRLMKLMGKQQRKSGSKRLWAGMCVDINKADNGHKAVNSDDSSNIEQIQVDTYHEESDGEFELTGIEPGSNGEKLIQDSKPPAEKNDATIGDIDSQQIVPTTTNSASSKSAIQ